MKIERWQEINRLFHEAAALPSEERTRWLREVCAGDEALRNEVESLLKHRDAPLEFLEEPAAARLMIDPEDLLQDLSADPLIGRLLGPYRIERRIATGGMGAVYQAVRRDEFLTHTVAVKVLHPSYDIEELRRRFRVERQTQANLSHPNIARLQDAGVTSDGLAYLIMEFIEGTPIDAYCDERRLDVRERLKLFQQVCGAVHFAHQNLIVHRDLKPSNILVNKDGVPKLLDFGVAKVVDPEQPQTPADRTETLKQMLSIDYASPEQLAGEPITTETDIYSLGVILYQLLVGSRPYRLTSRRFEEFERAIRLEDPQRPSTRLRKPTRNLGADPDVTKDPTPAEVALHRRTSPERLARVLRGDLDNIVMMALRKEPSRRYASAQQFAEDIQRYLNGQPVLARKDTFAYRTSKFIRRNRLAVGSMLLILLALAGGTIATAWQARVANLERDAARLAEKHAEDEADHAAIEAESANEIAEFLVDAFLVSSPRRSQEELLAAQGLLDQQVARVRRQFAAHPHLRANLLDAIGRVYQRLHLYEEAELLLAEATAIRLEEFGEESLEVGRSHNSLGELRYALGDFAEAERLFRKALRLHEELPIGVHTNVSLALNNLAATLRSLGRLAEAEPLHIRALEIRREEFGDRSLPVAESLQNLGVIDQASEKADSAIERFEEALAIRREVLGETHPLTVQSLHSMASAHFQAGRLEDAEPIIREVIDLYRRMPGGAHHELAGATRSLAELLRRKGEFEEAGRLLDEALAAQKRFQGPDHPNVAATLESMAMLAEGRGDLATALVHWREILRIRNACFPEDHVLRANALHGYGRVLVQSSQPAEAQQLLRESLTVYRAVLPAGHEYVATAEINLGVCLLELSQYDEAESMLGRGYASMQVRRGKGTREAEYARMQLIRLYDATGRKPPRELMIAPGGSN